MIRAAATVLTIIAAIQPALAECPLDRIETALAAPLGGMKVLEKDASEAQSTEGGVWRIHREKDGRVHTIIRIDGGESGRNDTRLSVVDRQTYGIASTRTDYIRHAFLEGPFANARVTTNYYFFCGGKLYLPDPGASMVDMEAYPKDAETVRARMIEDKDVAGFTKGLKR